VEEPLLGQVAKNVSATALTLLYLPSRDLGYQNGTAMNCRKHQHVQGRGAARPDGVPAHRADAQSAEGSRSGRGKSFVTDQVLIS
jgi:hypothetical protein